jgi:uncharacterized membrane protein
MRRGGYQLSASQRAGIVAASGSVPLSLVPLLRPRSAVDQGVVTGLAAAMNYALTTVTHDAVLATAHGTLRLLGARVDPRSTARTTLAVDVAALAASSVLLAALPQRAGEPAVRMHVRAVARRVGSAALAGIVPGLLGAMPGRDRPVGAALRTVPATVLFGAGISAGMQYARVRRLRVAGIEPIHDHPAPVTRSLGIGAVAAAGAVAVASGERGIARAADRAITRVTGAPGHGPLASHLLSASVIGVSLWAVATTMARRVEHALNTLDGALAEPPSSPLVSGGPGSAVAWAQLNRDARRHLASVTPAAEIRSTMGGQALDPIRLYVGLTSAPTVTERVRLAFDELERTGALDRGLLVLCSPTGNGYVNYVASSAWEHLSRGDCASLTLQYSLRPSLLSLDRVADGREQNTAMWAALAEVLARRDPADRPRVVLFGESLGAFTSQDAFLHTGTRGLRSRHVERALWLGTPHASGWAQELRDPLRPDVRPGEVLRLASADDLEGLPPEVARSARYVLLSHDDDGITRFSADLLVRSPDWLGPDRPSAVPPQAVWSTPITFLQTAVDAKNAAPPPVPGTFVGSGHDYRADLARCVRFAFGLPCTDAQLAAVEAALRQEEVARATRWAARPGGRHGPEGGTPSSGRCDRRF